MRKNLREIERKKIKSYEINLYYQHTLKLMVLESSLVLLACTLSSPTFCVVGLCLFKISIFEWGNTRYKFDLVQN